MKSLRIKSLNKYSNFLHSTICSLLVLGVAGSFSDAYAEVPTNVSLRYRVSLTTINKPNKTINRALHRITAKLNSTIGLNQSCEVTIRGCGQRFIPAGSTISPDLRDCDPVELGVINLGPGENTLSIRTRSSILKPITKSGMQISVQAQALCTDEDLVETSTITSVPRARKLSLNGSDKGGSVTRVLSQMIRNFLAL